MTALMIAPELVLTASQRDGLRDDGYTLVDLGLDEREITRARDEIVRIWNLRRTESRALDRGAQDFVRFRPELPRMHRESAQLTAFCRSAPFVSLAKTLIGDDADLSWNQAHVKAPGGDERTAIPWHQDGYYAELDAPFRFSCWVALTVSTVENGAMWGARIPDRPLLPHHWNERLSYFACDVDEATAFPLEVSPGHALLFDTRFPHRSGPNLSDAIRVGYSLSFTAADARLRGSGESFGDQLALVRGGRNVRELLRDYALAGSTDAEHPGARLLDSLRARLGARAPDVDALFARYRQALALGDLDADDIAQSLLVLSPDDVIVNGDLLRARTRVPQILSEATTVYRRGDVAGAVLLLRRALEIDPSNASATRALARLAPG